MNKDDFQKLQYEALRQEILSTQKRSLQTLGLGVVGIPAASYVAHEEIQGLSLFIPLFVVGIALLYLADNHGIMRCGEYIKEYIEKDLAEEDFIGWETWLERGTRSTELNTTWCFYLLFLLYFLAAVYMAYRYLLDRFDWPVAVIALVAYSALGIIAGRHLLRSLRLRNTG